MKLIKKTHLFTAIWLLPVIVIGGIFCFYTISYVAYEETDEYLNYEMQRLVKYHEQNNDIPDFHQVAKIVADQKCDEPFFSDTLILEEGDNEMIPYRELTFGLVHNGRNYAVTLRHLLLGRDDVFEGTVLIVLGLVILISLVLFFIINHIAKKIWRPFYNTLETLTSYKISEPIPVFQSGNVDEFNSLNKTLTDLLKTISRDYQSNKEFNENSSHELQTELAIIRANAEKIINNPDKTPENIEEFKNIYNSARKLSQMQKSLLLLSKISNREFQNNVSLDIAEVLNHSIEMFSEHMKMRNISLTADINSHYLIIDEGLATILINNLLKNAVIHNVDGGFINISLTETDLIIENSGSESFENPENYLKRFAKGRTGGSGIGLAIVKEICDIFEFQLAYSITDGRHKMNVKFKK